MRDREDILGGPHGPAPHDRGSPASLSKLVAGGYALPRLKHWNPEGRKELLDLHWPCCQDIFWWCFLSVSLLWDFLMVQSHTAWGPHSYGDRRSHRPGWFAIVAALSPFLLVESLWQSWEKSCYSHIIGEPETRGVKKVSQGQSAC